MVRSFALWFVSVCLFWFILFSFINFPVLENFIPLILIVGMVAALIFIYKIGRQKGNAIAVLSAISLPIIAFIMLLVFLYAANNKIFKSLSLNFIKPTPTITSQLDEKKLWNLVNNWEIKQGYQPYIEYNKLCETASSYLDFSEYWSYNYLKNILSDTTYINSKVAWNYAKNYTSEESVLNYWNTNPKSLSNLKEYYYYSCIRCKNNNCLQLFLNLPSPTNSNSANNSNNTNNDWGKVTKIGQYTYESNFNSDSHMATPNELLIAVNSYRQSNGKSNLSWDGDLANWAQSRAQTFANIKNVDQHAGFLADAPNKYNEFGDKFKGFSEDAAYGGKLEAVHIVEWMFAQDQPHKDVLLGEARAIGIGIATIDTVNYGIDLIFGK